MKWNKFFIVVGALNLVGGVIALLVIESGSGIANIVAGFICLYYGYRALEKSKSSEVEEMKKRLNDNWVSEKEKDGIRAILQNKDTKVS